MDKKKQIYRVSIKLFNKYGLDKTPTSRISKEAGVQLFCFFNSKNELINYVYLASKESLLNSIKLEINEEKSFKDKVKKMFINYICWGIGNIDEFMFIQQFSNSPYILNTNRQDGISLLKELFDEGVKKEIIKNADINYLFWIITSLLNANVQYLIANQYLKEDKEFLDRCFEFLWDSINNY